MVYTPFMHCFAVPRASLTFSSMTNEFPGDPLAAMSFISWADWGPKGLLPGVLWRRPTRSGLRIPSPGPGLDPGCPGCTPVLVVGPGRGGRLLGRFLPGSEPRVAGRELLMGALLARSGMLKFLNGPCPGCPGCPGRLGCPDSSRAGSETLSLPGSTAGSSWGSRYKLRGLRIPLLACVLVSSNLGMSPRDKLTMLVLVMRTAILKE